MIRIALILALGALPRLTHGFAPTLIGGFNFKLPWESDSSSPSSTSTTLQPGDTVAVIGASGNVGKLVALRLSDTYQVNGVVRETTTELERFFEDRGDRVRLYEADLLEELQGGGEGGGSLAPALRSASAIVICTGTTAFPTEAWSRSGEFSVTGEVLRALADNKFSVRAAIADLDARGLNTPNNVDDRANALVLEEWERVGKAPKKRVVLLSSIGVQRRNAMPFPILNACGVLDAKAKAEEGLIEAAGRSGYSYSIIRPGQLFGGPYDNNYYLGTLFQLDKDSDTQDVDVGRGDELLGDTLRSTLAEITAQICEGDCAKDMDFAAVNVKGEIPSADTIQERLQAL